MSDRVSVARAVVIAAMVLAGASSARAANHVVPAEGDLQAALDAAQPGDIILLAPGASYIGNFRLPLKPGAAFITIRTNAPATALPRPGERVSPAFAGTLARIQSPNAQPALTAYEGSHHWRLETLEFGPNANGTGDIIVLGGSASQTTLEQMPHHIVLDRLYIHGDPIAGQKRGVALNSGATEVINSYISDIKAVGVDSQALCGWNGIGPFLIQNNYLEAAGENIMFGGADPSIPELVPADIVVRGNLLSKPLQWRQERWQVKNAFELKNARRVLIEGNVFEHVWAAAQAGFAVLLSTRNQNGKALWSTVEDVTFRYNIIRHAANAININGYDNQQASQQGQRYQISHNVMFDIGGAEWGGGGIFLQMGNQPRDVVVEHNTVQHTGVVVSVYGTPRDPYAPISGFLFRDNVMRHNLYGVKGQSVAVGKATLAAFFTNVVFESNALAGGDARLYPAGNYFPPLTDFDAAFVNSAEGDFRLVPGSAFAAGASDGGALGADVGRVMATVNGTAVETSDEGNATCRPGRRCAAVR